MTRYKIMKNMENEQEKEKIYFKLFILWTINLNFEVWTLNFMICALASISPLPTTNFTNYANAYCNVIRVIRGIRSSLLVVYELTGLRVDRLLASINITGSSNHNYDSEFVNFELIVVIIIMNCELWILNYSINLY